MTEKIQQVQLTRGFVLCFQCFQVARNAVGMMSSCPRPTKLLGFGDSDPVLSIDVLHQVDTCGYYQCTRAQDCSVLGLLSIALRAWESMSGRFGRQKQRGVDHSTYQSNEVSTPFYTAKKVVRFIKTMHISKCFWSTRSPSMVIIDTWPGLWRVCVKCEVIRQNPRLETRRMCQCHSWVFPLAGSEGASLAPHRVLRSWHKERWLSSSGS